MAGVLVELATPRFGIPHECPCCGAPPSAEITVGPRKVLFPYCKRCVEHTRLWDNATLPSAAAMLVTIVACVWLLVSTGVLVALGVFALGAAIAWPLRVARRTAAAAAKGPSCAASGCAVAAAVPNGFMFESPTFAARFAEDNKSNLANPSAQLQRLLDGYQRARLAVPTPAIAAGVAPPPLNTREWLARIEATTGTLERRVQLQRALDMTAEGSDRRELLRTGARLELALVSMRAATMNATEARRLLDATVAHVREDNLSEELQAVMIAELEARLAEIK